MGREGQTGPSSEARGFLSPNNRKGLIFSSNFPPFNPQREKTEQKDIDHSRTIRGELKKESGLSTAAVAGVGIPLVGGSFAGGYFVHDIFASENPSQISIDSFRNSFNQERQIIDNRNTSPVDNNSNNINNDNKSPNESQPLILTTGDKASEPTIVPNETQPPILNTGDKTEQSTLIPITPEPSPTPTEPAPAVTQDNPTPTVTPKPTEVSPTRTPTQETESKSCSPWPEEVAEMRRNLPVLQGTCFAYYTELSQIPYEDIREAWSRAEGGANADVPRRIIHHYIKDGPKEGPGPKDPDNNKIWEILTVAHEICHFHQAEMSRQDGMDPDARPNFQESYLNTQEGKDYIVASNEAIANARSRGIDFRYPFPWQTRVFGTDKYEEAADVCAISYIKPEWLDGDVLSPLRNWAKKWFPKEATG